jgi:four helix bundle protein
VKGYRRVIAFKKADDLASLCFDVAERIQARDRWLASQLKRASLSAPLNIVEGHGRGTLKDFLKFLETAQASLNEVEYLLDFLNRKDIVSDSEYDRLDPVRSEAAAVLAGLIRSLRLKLKVTNNWQRNLSDGHVEYHVPGDEEDE